MVGFIERLGHSASDIYECGKNVEEICVSEHFVVGEFTVDSVFEGVVMVAGVDVQDDRVGA